MTGAVTARETLHHPGVGRADAPAGTADWAQHHLLALVADSGHLTDDLRLFARHLDVVAGARGWTLMKRKAGGAFATAHEWVEAPKPFGLGTPVAELLRRLDLVAEGRVFKAVLRGEQPSPDVFVGLPRPLGPGERKPWPRPEDGPFVPPPAHPAAELLPLLGEAELADLADDIAAHGQREPIVLWDGQVLDGRNRLAACERAGVLPAFRALGHCPDPVAYVLSANLCRRHLSESQRAMVAARALPLLSEQARARQMAHLKQGESAPEPVSPDLGERGKATEQAARMVNVGRGTVEAAARVQRHGAPELVAAVDRGEVAVSAAAAVATLPAAEQRAAVAAGKVAEKAKATRAGKKTGSKAKTRDATARAAEIRRAIEAAPTPAAAENAYGASQEGLSSEQREALGAALQRRVAELAAPHAPAGQLALTADDDGTNPPWESKPQRPSLVSSLPPSARAMAWVTLVRRVYEQGDPHLRVWLDGELAHLFTRGCALEFAFDSPAVRLFAEVGARLAGSPR